MVDAGDSKSPDRKVLSVRVRPRVPPIPSGRDGMVDIGDLKSLGHGPWGFESPRPHHLARPVHAASSHRAGSVPRLSPAPFAPESSAAVAPHSRPDRRNAVASDARSVNDGWHGGKLFAQHWVRIVPFSGSIRHSGRDRGGIAIQFAGFRADRGLGPPRCAAIAPFFLGGVAIFAKTVLSKSGCAAGAAHRTEGQT